MEACVAIVGAGDARLLVVRIATFNIQHGAAAAGGTGTLDGLIDACRGLDADLLALQEVDRGVGRTGRVDQAAEIAGALGMTYTFGSTRRIDGGDYGNALLVRGDLAEVRVISLERRFRTEPRCLVTATATIGGDAYSVGVTHLGVDNALAHHQLIQTIDTMAVMASPRVIAGDFNLHPDEVLPTTTAEGYELVLTAPTFPNIDPVVQIDHVALLGLEAKDVDVASTPVSDHRALVVDVAPT
jgi:endonuclease/exonuclease/phosphatase family metal-dependent hydrolase